MKLMLGLILISFFILSCQTNLNKTGLAAVGSVAQNTPSVYSTQHPSPNQCQEGQVISGCIDDYHVRIEICKNGQWVSNNKECSKVNDIYTEYCGLSGAGYTCLPKEGTCCRCFWFETFEKDADGNYIIDEDGNRVRDAQSIIAEEWCSYSGNFMNCDEIKSVKIPLGKSRDEVEAEEGCKGANWMNYQYYFVGHSKMEFWGPTVNICQRADCQIDVIDYGCCLCQDENQCCSDMQALADSGKVVSITGNPGISHGPASPPTVTYWTNECEWGIIYPLCNKIEFCHVGDPIITCKEATGEIKDDKPVYRYVQKRCCCPDNTAIYTVYKKATPENPGHVEGILETAKDKTDICKNECTPSKDTTFIVSKSQKECAIRYDYCEDSSILVDWFCSPLDQSAHSSKVDCRNYGQICDAGKCIPTTLNTDIQDMFTSGNFNIDLIRGWFTT
jgi:hypothetical protein